MTKRTIALLLALGLAATAWATTYNYSSGVDGLDVTTSNQYVAFTNNHSGGTGRPFGALYVTIVSRPGSDDCQFDLIDNVATTADNVVPGGGKARIYYPTSADTDGFAGIARICKSGNSATWDVTAWR